MAGSFDGKVALVTGGSTGIGRATAVKLARDGAKVVVSDVIAEGGKDTVGMIKGSGGKAVFVHADVSRTSHVEALISKIV
jgi:NAD(P)-dependent dehydrogenase (short-subunit alcohol dehydrogenase family)